MTTVHMLVTTGQGPRECGAGLGGFRAPFEETAERLGVEVDWNAQHPDEPRSVLIALHGSQAQVLAEAFEGVWAWRSRSPWRREHRRSLWCMRAFVLETPSELPVIEPGAITWRTMRAGGPGGQHQNTTDSAVVATWVCPRSQRVFTGRARDGRSQHRNRVLALQRLQEAVAHSVQSDGAHRDARVHALRAGRPTGEPVAVLEGPDFTPRTWPFGQ